jgi:hypothetical protein
MLSLYCLTCDFPCYYSYAKSSTTKGLQQSLKLKHKINMLRNAKSLIRLQTNLTTRILEKGEVVYAEGDVGDSMFHVDEYDGGKAPPIFTIHVFVQAYLIRLELMKLFIHDRRA